MKILNFKLLVGIIAISMFFVACDKDDVNLSDHLMISETEYDLDKGSIKDYGIYSTSPNSYNFDIYLLGESISRGTGGSPNTGTGPVIFFQLYSSLGSDLAPGTYTYASVGGAASTYDYAYYYKNYEDGYGTKTLIKSGTLKVEKSGSIYTLTIDCVDVDGKEVTGYYNSTLNYYDRTKKASDKELK